LPPQPPSTLIPALGRTKELFRQNGVNALLNDYLVSLGLYLLALGMTVCYVAVMLLCYTEFIGFGFSSTGPAEGLGAVWVLLLVVPLLMGPGAVYFWTTLEVVRSSQKAIFVCFIQVIHSFMVILAAEWTLRPIASRAFCTDSWRGKTACAFLKLLTLVPRRLYTQKIFPRYNIFSAGILHISTQFGCEHAL